MLLHHLEPQSKVEFCIILECMPMEELIKFYRHFAHGDIAHGGRHTAFEAVGTMDSYDMPGSVCSLF